MNKFLSVVRHISLYGFIFLVLSLIFKETEKKPLFILLGISVAVYLLFMFITWLSVRSSTRKMSSQFGVDIPVSGFGNTLIRGLGIDIIAPILVIIDMFKDKSGKVVMLVITYAVIAVYVCLWFWAF